MMKKYILGGISLLIAFTGVWMLIQRMVDAKDTITPEEVEALMAADSTCVIIDVRTPEEFHGESGHIAGSLLIPIQELDARMSELRQYKQRQVVAVCRSGNRSGRATTMLNNSGFTARNMVGGMLRWNAEHRPTAREMAP
jgi:rhodanese-related sulfurtransferase